VHFAGWESDTLTLQRAGWQFSANQDVKRSELQFVLKHEVLKIYGLSQKISRFEYAHYFRDNLHGFTLPVIEVKSISCDLKVIAMANIASFVPINAQPIFNHIFNPRNIDDFKIFASIRKPEHQIIIDPNDTQKLLNRVLELQSPKQAEIREKRNKEIRNFLRENSDTISEIKMEDNIFAEVLI
jgi:hypothetical protein